jgi:Arc/MetJ family transcription regulator
MRTTVAIDDAILARAKKRAASRGQTLGEYVESALRRELTIEATPRIVPELPVFVGGTGMRAGIDASSTRALFDALDADADGEPR